MAVFPFRHGSQESGFSESHGKATSKGRRWTLAEEFPEDVGFVAAVMGSERSAGSVSFRGANHRSVIKRVSWRLQAATRDTSACWRYFWH
jgi:hypothetical protein